VENDVPSPEKAVSHVPPPEVVVVEKHIDQQFVTPHVEDYTKAAVDSDTVDELGTEASRTVLDVLPCQLHPYSTLEKNTLPYSLSL
jgi:hypothetical protein